MDAYLAAGSLPADSGMTALVLLTDQPAGDSTPLTAAVDISGLVDLDPGSNLPAARAVSALYGENTPALPGLVIVGTLTGYGQAL